MTLSLILWKRPLADDPEQARLLLKPFYDRGDDSGFETSDDIRRCADELRRLYPDGPAPDPDSGSPWAELPIHQSDRLLSLTLRSSAGDEVVDEIADLAYEHGLVLYDPQGPYLFLPDDLTEPEAPPGPSDWVRFALFGLGSVGLLALGQWVTVPVLDMVLTAFGGFLTAVFLFILIMFIAQRRR